MFIKTFENFKLNNIEGGLISKNDILDCIKKHGDIYSTVIQGYPENDPDVALKPIEIDTEGNILVQIDNEEYTVKIENVERIEF